MAEKNKYGLTLEQAIEKVLSSQSLYMIYPSLKKDRILKYVKSFIRVKEYGSNAFYKVNQKKIINNDKSDDIER